MRRLHHSIERYVRTGDTRMEHNEAMELKAAERYVLRELPEDLREAYEEHFFDCAECAADIHAATLFASTSRDIFAEDQNHPALAQDKSPGSLWSRWLRPAFAAPLFAAVALALLAGYQNLVTIPQLQANSAASVQVLRSFSLAGADSRGSAVRVAIRRGESFALTFDIPPGHVFAQYLCQLRDSSGRALRQVSISAEQANKSVELLLPAGMMLPGTYSIAIAGDADHTAQFREQDKFADLGFQIAFEN
jgi:hypothetical protein